MRLTENTKKVFHNHAVTMVDDKKFLRTFPQKPIDSDLRFRYGDYIKEKPGLGGPGLAVIRSGNVLLIIADFEFSAILNKDCTGAAYVD